MLRTRFAKACSEVPAACPSSIAAADSVWPQICGAQTLFSSGSNARVSTWYSPRTPT